MAKRITAIITALALVVAFSFALVGCGKFLDESEFVGNYKLVKMVENGEETTQENLSMMESFGLVCTLDLYEDHSATLSLFGSEIDGTWEPVEQNSGHISLPDISATTIDFTIDSNVLQLTQNGIEMSFGKR